MATAFGPERLSGPSSGPAFDSPADRFAASMNSLNGSQSIDCGAQADEPPPNPPFVFPAQPPVSASAPSSFSRATGRRPMSAIETPNFSFGFSAENAERNARSALPDFSFNPGAMLSPDRENNFLLTPPISPHSPRNGASQQRPGGHGHRRGGSEFVGGRLREGNSIAIMSTSPTKSESGLVSPAFQIPPRRGHRRGISGAISTNDLPILQPPVFDSAGRGNSAPTSPTDYEQPNNQGPLKLDEQITPDPEPVPKPEASKVTTDPVAKSSPDSSPKNPKARVGFSDTLEFIPRPLSLVSNETSSTVTARPGHSLSGSISSIVSANSPSGRDSPSPLSQTPTREISDSRPSTAGAILENTNDLANAACSPKRRNSIPTLLNFADTPKAEDPEPSPTRKRWSFFAREHSSGNTSPGKARPQSAGSLDLLTREERLHPAADLTPLPKLLMWCRPNPRAARRARRRRRKSRAGPALFCRENQNLTTSARNPKVVALLLLQHPASPDMRVRIKCMESQNYCRFQLPHSLSRSLLILLRRMRNQNDQLMNHHIP
ncbi:hypothetical protein NXS19_012511 [Fusarium pseudograminearum]|nr:hypothetical protein NXS19_012511 [Fusarium pseudograminearum]